MRVLIDAVLGPPHPRGVGRYVSELARQVHGSGAAQVVVAIAAWHRDFFAPLGAAGVELAEVSVGMRRGARNAWHMYGAGRLARAVRAELIHVPDRLPVRATAGRPLVVTIHDTAEVDLPDAFGALQARYRRWVLRDQLRRATLLIAPSHFAAARIGALAPSAVLRTMIVAHGPGLDPAQPMSPPAELRGQRFVLFVGAVQRHKDVPTLVRAFRAVDVTGTVLVIAGAAHNDERAVATAIGDDRHIIRLPAPADAELAWLYRHAQVLAMPSRYEGFCIPLVEAMQVGCPVIAADAGAMPEICGDAALLFPGADVPALAGMLEQVLSDEPLRARLSQAGRTRAADFSWQRTAAQTVAAYRAALA